MNPENEMIIYCPQCRADMTPWFSYSIEDADAPVFNGFFCDECDFNIYGSLKE